MNEELILSKKLLIPYLVLESLLLCRFLSRRISRIIFSYVLHNFLIKINEESIKYINQIQFALIDEFEYIRDYPVKSVQIRSLCNKPLYLESMVSITHLFINTTEKMTFILSLPKDITHLSLKGCLVLCKYPEKLEYIEYHQNYYNTSTGPIRFPDSLREIFLHHVETNIDFISDNIEIITIVKSDIQLNSDNFKRFKNIKKITVNGERLT